MKRNEENQGYRAAEFEGVFASENSRGGYLDRRLYTLEGVGGVWRRVPGDSTHPDLVRAFFRGGLIKLVPQPVIEAELGEAGFRRESEVEIGLRSVFEAIAAGKIPTDRVSVQDLPDGKVVTLSGKSSTPPLGVPARPREEPTCDPFTLPENPCADGVPVEISPEAQETTILPSSESGPVQEQDGLESLSEPATMEDESHGQEDSDQPVEVGTDSSAETASTATKRRTRKS